MLIKLNYRFINFSIIIKLHITKASTVQCKQRCIVNQNFWGPTYVEIDFPIKSAKTIITLDSRFKTNLNKI